MTPDEMRAQSGEKVKRIMELMGSLNIRVEARERMTPEGFIEKTVFWIDDEKYLSPLQTADPALQAKEVAPAAEVAP